MSLCVDDRLVCRFGWDCVPFKPAHQTVIYTEWHIPDVFFFCYGAATQRGSWPPRSWGFLDHIQRRTTVGRTPLDEWSARRTDFYLTKHNTHNRQTSMPPVGFEPTISTGERPQTYVLDRAATGTGTRCHIDTINSPDDGHMAAPKHVENRNKHTWKIVVRQVGYLQGLTL